MEAKSSHIIDSDFQSSSTNLWPMKQGFFPDTIADDEDDDEESRKLAWLKSSWFKRLIQVCAVVSVISMSLNSPATFELFPVLFYVTLTLDIVVAIVLTIEMAAQIHKFSFRAYLKRRNCIFNFIMIILILVSIILQFVELSGCKPKPYTMFSIPRAPRALIMLRVFKAFVKFKLSEEVSRRSRRQIWSVTIFFAYFMTLASIIGIQMFGAKNHYCVRNSTDLNNVTYSDLPLPEARCSLSRDRGYSCPEDFRCELVHMNGFMSARLYFDHFGHSILTVYVSATQEGWVLVMYQMMNVRSKELVAIYFVLLIFFLALLVKNVFIAVVSETFADLRSHYTMSRRQTRRRRYTGLSSLVIKDHGAGWHLVSVDHEASKGHAPLPIRRIIGSAFVQYFIWTCVLVDALIQALNKDWRREAQFIFTILFDIEALLKIWCSGFRAYLNNSRMQFLEFVVAVGSTIFAIPVLLGHNAFAVFHVTRVIRLIGAVPGLQAFSLKIFGTGKKLGSIILFTFFFVMLLSSIGMQLFSTLQDDGEYLFGTYLQSLQSMFQILTQEGWVEVMEKAMKSAEEVVAAILVAFFLTMYHVFSSLIIMSVFVAVIVDNLELDEDVKLMKQHKMDEETGVTHEKLPLRIRVYERFKEDPRLVKMSRLKFASEFPTPKIRESFMRRFVNIETSLTDLPLELSSGGKEGGTTPGVAGRRAALHHLPVQLLNSSISEASRSTKIFRKQSTVSALINDSNHRRTIAQLSPTDIHGQKNPGFRSASRRFRSGGRAGRTPVTEADVKRAIVMASQGNKKLHSQLSQEDGIRKDWDIQSVRQKREQAESRRRFQEETLRENHPFFDQPLFALPRDSWLRNFLQSVVQARYILPPGYRERATRNRLVSIETFQKIWSSQTYLEWTMIFITLASCLSMMMERLEESTFQNVWTSTFEHFFVVAMSIELGIHIFANGLLFTPNAVIQNFGGVLDMFIYFNGLVYICWQPKEVRAGSGAQILMILRCFRPLRIMTLMPKMKKVIMELCGGYKEILKVSALQLILMFSFAIYGVQVFSDNLKRCTDGDIETRENCTGYFFRKLASPRELSGLSGEIPSMLAPRVWKNPRNFDFDDVFSAFLALVEVLSLEGWLEVRDVIEDKVGPQFAVYVHIYVLFGSMIGLTLFVGVVVTNFNEHKGIALLTVDQRRWQDLKKRLKLAQPLHLPPRPDDPGLHKMLYDVMQSVFYRRIVAVIVLMECLTLAVAQWTTADPRVRDGVTTLAAACTLFFVIDAILKILAYTFEGYWRSMRNRFDMLLTSLGIIWIILNFSLKGTDMYQNALIFGVVIIVFRFLTLSGKHNTLKMLMLTVVMSLWKSFFTITVLVVLMMCYSLAGVILFGSVKYGEAINRHANFQTSFNAMILLFRIITGEDWNKVMHDCMINEPYCTPADDTNWTTDCGNKAASLIFFISFYVLVTFVLLNVFVAVIIENFSLFYASDEDSYLSNTDLRDFQMAWNLVDKGRRGVMSVPQAKLFLRVYIFFKQNNYLKGRLGVDERGTSFRHMCCEIEKLRNGGDVSFHDVLGVIAYRTVDITHCLQLEELLEREELEYTIDQEVAIQTIRDWFIKLRMKREKEKLQKERASPLVSSNESLNNVGLPDADSDRELRDREHRERDRLSSGEEEDKEPEKPPPGRTLSSQSAGFLAPPSSPPRQRKFSGPDRVTSVRKTSTVTFPTEVIEPPPASPVLRARQRQSSAEQKENSEVKDWWTAQMKDDFPFPPP